ncbi:DUF2711 family protein [Aneurinibacillus uraniidurans]|uniref:DUF2711 family protein n=1 Tax=Aneurinibacillus uraniidurans TaxID=2966586 RepID=UPI0023496C3A|nr:DUF2711 family protein [Aneurinibacillus sp. B1]WCN39495.1 DUF2711 family protein [Aneurinibacillus sp. B1]
MLNYIWLNDKSSILKQLPQGFKTAAILLHPFVQMPLGWAQSKQKNECEPIYPSNEEILNLGEPVSWEQVLKDSGLKTHEELALALKTSIGALRQEYARTDLADKLNLNFKTDLYYPTEDSTSVFLISGLLKVLGSNGANKFFFSEPIFDKSGILEIDNITLLEISELTDKELILMDENMKFAFMSVYDSFFTLFFTKDENITQIVQSRNWEAIICNNETYINWYLSRGIY